jgi:phage gp36-like protein
MASYATPAHIKVRYNVTRVGQLVRDDGSTASPTQLDTDANLQAALDDASGEIELAALAGQRYATTDLQALKTAYAAGPSNSQYNSGALLVRLTCDLAYGNLIGRKGMDAATTDAMAPRVRWAQAVLQQLRDGDRIFNIDANTLAGLPLNVEIGKQRTYLTQYMSRYFGDLTTDPNNLFVK